MTRFNITAVLIMLAVVALAACGASSTPAVCTQVAAAYNAVQYEPVNTFTQLEKQVADMQQVIPLVEGAKAQCPGMWKAYNTGEDGTPLPAN